jgi:hypothetical protein
MRRSLVVVLAAGVLLAGCTSSGGSAPSTPATESTSASSAAAAQLAGKVQQGVAGLRSAHLQVLAGALGGNIAGDVTFAKGETTASDVTIDQGNGPVEVITVKGTSYAKLPSSHNTSGKPWVQVKSDSSNEFVRALSGTLSLTGAATSLGALTGLLETAVTSVKDTGQENVTGVDAEHYGLMIDPKKATGELASVLSVAGSKPLPVDLWIDAQGRPVQIRIAVPFGQQSLPLLVKVSKFNAPVHISAPPASQVSTG